LPGERGRSIGNPRRCATWAARLRPYVSAGTLPGFYGSFPALSPCVWRVFARLGKAGEPGIRLEKGESIDHAPSQSCMGADVAQPFPSTRRNGAQLTAAIARPEPPWGSESVCNNQTAVAALSQTANTTSYPGVRNGTFLPMKDAS